jgi:hypothetical protein
MKIDGFDKLSRQLDEAQRALAALEGDLGQVEFDPSDPASIEQALQSMETMLDSRAGKWANNPIVAELLPQMKAKYRQQILDKAAQHRLQGASDD